MKVFISYARADRHSSQFEHGDTEIISKLLSFLRHAGYDVWIDSAQLKASQDWEREIHSAVRDSHVMLCFASPNWAASQYCPIELKLALDFGKPVLPILLADDPALPALFRVRQYVDFRQGISLRSLGKFVAGLREIERAVSDIVQNILGTPFEWVDVPAGEVVLKDCSRRTMLDLPCSGPVGSVRSVAPFAIARYPVTVEQFALFIEREDGYSDPGWWSFCKRAQEWRMGEGKQPQPPVYVGERLPRTNVAWYDAVAFCRWLSSISGENVRLPSEAEWQWAAQGPDGRAYPWGIHFDPLRCNYLELLPNDPRDFAPTPVNEYPEGASPFGVMDMSGNVWEWVSTGLRCSPLHSPQSVEIQELDVDVSRMLRGGSGKRVPGEQERLTVTYREEVDRPSRRSRSRGFRIARS